VSRRISQNCGSLDVVNEIFVVVCWYRFCFLVGVMVLWVLLSFLVFRCACIFV